MGSNQGNKLYNNIGCLPLWTIPALKISSCRIFFILIFCWLNVFSFFEKHMFWFEIEVTDCTTNTNIVNLMVFLKNISLYFCLLERGISKWDSIKLGDRGQSTEKHAENVCSEFSDNDNKNWSGFWTPNMPTRLWWDDITRGA